MQFSQLLCMRIINSKDHDNRKCVCTFKLVNKDIPKVQYKTSWILAFDTMFSFPLD